MDTSEDESRPVATLGFCRLTRPTMRLARCDKKRSRSFQKLLNADSDINDINRANPHPPVATCLDAQTQDRAAHFASPSDACPDSIRGIDRAARAETIDHSHGCRGCAGLLLVFACSSAQAIPLK
jgi:hypothetical protein